jgi:hypothetical protein
MTAAHDRRRTQVARVDDRARLLYALALRQLAAAVEAGTDLEGGYYAEVRRARLRLFEVRLAIAARRAAPRS